MNDQPTSFRLEEEQARLLLQHLKPQFHADHAALFDRAADRLGERLYLSRLLINADMKAEAKKLLQSIAARDIKEQANKEFQQIIVQAKAELAELLMDELYYDEAELLLWQVREQYESLDHAGLEKGECSLLIADCRFGQGFMRDAIERAEEVLHELQAANSSAAEEKALFPRIHQRLGWYYFHLAEINQAFDHMRTALEKAENVDAELLHEGKQAEQSGELERAMTCYFDAILS